MPELGELPAILQGHGRSPAGKTLDRINNDRGYEPDNCRWATRKEQGRNTRTNKTVVINGEAMTMMDGSEKHGVNYRLV